MFEVKTATVDQLKVENKALAEMLIAEGRAAGLAEGKAAGIIEGRVAGIEEGKSAENKRVAGIIASMPEGLEVKALSAIKEGKTVEEAKDAYLQAFQKEAPTPPGPNGEEKIGVKSHLTKAQEYQKEHKCGIAEALSATAEVRQAAK